MKKNHYIIIIVIVSVISFYAWMQYKAYQIRSSLSTVFSWFAEGLKDNSKKETPKVYKQIKIKEFATLSWSKNSDSQMSIWVRDIVWKWKSFTQSYSKYDAKNEFLVVNFESENIGEKPNFFPLSDWLLITKDWVEYKADSNTLQQNDLDKAYGWCISCSSNPWDKNIEWLLFDIKKIDLTGAKIRFENESIEFDL